MTLQISDDNRVRTLTLNRPDVLNAFNEELYEATTIALREAATDPDVQRTVLDCAEQLIRPPVQLLTGTRVVGCRRPCQVQRPARLQLLRIDRWHRSARRTEQRAQGCPRPA